MHLKRECKSIWKYTDLLFAFSNPVRVSKCLGSKIWSHSEKAIAANTSAVREWDSNGTVFGYNPHITGNDAGEFGHNDFYSVVIAACQNNN